MQYHQRMHFPAPHFSTAWKQKPSSLDTSGIMEPTTFAPPHMHTPHRPPSSSPPSSTATIGSTDSIDPGQPVSPSSDVPSPPSSNKLKILYLGDPILYNTEKYDQLLQQFEIIRPQGEDLRRDNFIRHLKHGTWGNFSAILRPFWASGNEMARWDKELIDLLPSGMKVMASAGAGFDWVDTDDLASRGILYCNGAGASTESVADMALCFIIMVFRQMVWSFLAARSGVPEEWQEAHEQVPVMSFNPSGRTLGIVGFGNIGFAIAKKVKAAVGMKIIYHDVCRKRDQEGEVKAVFYERLEDLLPACECILIATPHTGKALLNAKTLKMLPRGARVVNIARGTLIDEDALADALQSGHISAAALDVHADEPNVNVRLRQMRNVMLTSHTGGGTLETKKGFETLAMENVELVLSGKAPKTAVNQDRIRSLASVNGNGKHHLSADEVGSAKKHQGTSRTR